MNQMTLDFLSKFRVQSRGGGGGGSFIDIGRCEGCGFQAVYSGIDGLHRNQTVLV